MITQKAKEKIARFISEYFDEINIGTGGDTSNPNLNNLDAPIFTPAVRVTKLTTNTISDNTTIDFYRSFSGTELEGYSIKEIGIFGTLPAELLDFTNMEGVDGGTGYPAPGIPYRQKSGVAAYDIEEVMLTRINFEGIGPIASSDTLEIILTIEVE